MDERAGADASLEDRAAIPPATACAYPVRAGNLVRPLLDSRPTFERIVAAVAAARHSLWVTVAFCTPGFVLPDGAGSLFDLFDAAAARGLDVRVLFWRPEPASSGYGDTFGGSPDDRVLLRARGSVFRARWDRAPGAYCQHQKTWLLDAGHAGETAFIGGINPTVALASPGHAGGTGRHDLFVEVSGPAASDVHHNFVQRWNEASERMAADGTWGQGADEPMPHPSRASPPCGPSRVQIQRMIAPGRYADDHPAPSGRPYAIAAGERSVLEQYLSAIEAARSSIYIENQALPAPEVSARLEAALARGVGVVLLVPAEPEAHVRTARREGSNPSLFAGIEALGRHAGFRLAGLAAPVGPGRVTPIYVHAKAMLVDDAWATIGSCNLHSRSLSGHSELNAAIWDRDIVRGLRRALLSEHLGQDTEALDDRAAFGLYRAIADRNRAGLGDPAHRWQGLAFALDPARYGL